jgi:hypothetical protein
MNIKDVGNVKKDVDLAIQMGRRSRNDNKENMPPIEAKSIRNEA